MTPDQKAITRALLDLCYENGFNCSYPLQPIVDGLGIKGVAYDNNTETGIMWDLGPHGNGTLMIDHHGSAAIDRAMLFAVSTWCDYRG